MGSLVFLVVACPLENGLHAVLHVNEEGQAEPLLGRTRQNVDGAKQMTKNVLAFGDNSEVINNVFYHTVTSLI